MIIGKNPETLGKSTFYYNHMKGEWVDGPELKQSRVNSAIGIVIDNVTQEEMVVVMGGNAVGTSGAHLSLDSTEILLIDPHGQPMGNWSKGEKEKIICQKK